MWNVGVGCRREREKEERAWVGGLIYTKGDGEDGPSRGQVLTGAAMGAFIAGIWRLFGQLAGGKWRGHAYFGRARWPGRSPRGDGREGTRNTAFPFQPYLNPTWTDLDAISTR